ncbi:Uncharacterised protein [Mycobacteroides abscessus subsp. massiliense]|nr:hypothetical protein [Mycobacteroides abscessus]SKM18135.1 Uncharacterised protein [Mycobacteroides abscessus subsp. massiliense]MDM2426910.1 hypothetical protein [Mycobacteroides abscessus]MDM2431760.1 hypothetical protein [Mycobacteroides abscessus]MDM2436627.1 hypothetical protein [Mycobacteroides abscessus]
MATATETDISSLVDSAYSEMECIYPTDGHVGHGGDTAALFVGHDCMEGLICRNHFKEYVEVVRPTQVDAFRGTGTVTCDQCWKRFCSIDEFVKVYPL